MRRASAGTPILRPHRATEWHKVGTRPIAALITGDDTSRGKDAANLKGQFEMKKYVHVKFKPPGQDEKQAELAKTARLRALRLLKEAADKETAARDSATSPPRSRKRQPNQPLRHMS